jgi:serine/threonine protein kinase
MNYTIEDITYIARVLLRRSKIELPTCLQLTETDAYAFCYEANIDTDILDSGDFGIEMLITFLKKLAEEDKFVLFLDYYFKEYFDNKITELSEEGYNVFSLKENVLLHINSGWSISGQEFAFDSNGLYIKAVEFKEYDKKGEGGFCTVYNNRADTSSVIKVLNIREKSDVGSVYRFKREYEIMQEHNNSGFTINVFGFESHRLIYCMEKADISLEDYLENNPITDAEKDEIISRCVECMKYLHKNGVLHRDFHPGNILRNSKGEWVVTDFGLAKDIDNKYSHQTTTTHAVGRALFTDPVQLFLLKEGNFKTDMYSLAKTIDFVMNQNLSGKAHKYSSVVYKATAPDMNNRYDSIDDFYDEVRTIFMRDIYESVQERIGNLLNEYSKNKNINVTEIISLLSNDSDGSLIWELVLQLQGEWVDAFVEIAEIAFSVALSEIAKLKDVMERGYHDWNEYDNVAYWARDIIYARNGRNDEINIIAAQIIEYVADNVQRYKIRTLANSIKVNDNVDGHIRAKISYFEGY